MTEPSASFGPDPDYENPPVIETVLGVQFDRLPRLQNGHLGAFWKTLDPMIWMTVSDAPSLAQQAELFDEMSIWERGLRLQVSTDPACRLQIRDATKDRMIQIQNGRLHLNWLGGDRPLYPRHQALFAEFFGIFNQFAAFVEREQAGEFRPNQWEVTYVNQMERGTVWDSPADWNFFRPLNSVSTLPGIAEGESFSGEWHFVIPEQRGRLHVEWQHGKQELTSPAAAVNDFVRLTLTARGPLPADRPLHEAIQEGLELGRKTTVHAFRNLMSDQANRYWGLKHAH